jgi:hypothetical protein
LPGSEILLDLSNAVILNQTNTASELSVSAVFNEVLPIGTYPATKVVFGFDPDYFHGTTGLAFGTFADGEPFRVEVSAGFIPEPSTSLLLFLSASCLAFRRARD